MNCFPDPCCRCCECQGIHCFSYHPGHSHRTADIDPVWPWLLGPRQETQAEFNERFQEAADKLVSAIRKEQEDMSWSNSWMGKPSAIKAAIGRYAATLTGLSKEEFDAARPALETLLDQNSNIEKEPIVALEANGHAYVKDGARQYSACSVTLKQIGILVE